jgi:hypothetical protein
MDKMENDFCADAEDQRGNEPMPFGLQTQGHASQNRFARKKFYLISGAGIGI